MLQLHIDGMRVNLPDSASTEYNILNPFFTNQGDYTLDIDIPLDDPENARVYHNIHRIDHTRRKLRRTAILSDEHGILAKGQEVLLEVDGKTAKIQIVGGASEFNYIAGDQTLQQLDLWVPYDASEMVFPPVCVFNDSDHAAFDVIDSEEWVTEDSARVRKWRVVNRPRWRRSDFALDESHEIGQPYLWAVVRRVVQALGFEIGTSVIETDSRYSSIIMVHGYSSRFIAETLPPWTVSQFFDEIQKFFNVIVTVDSSTRQVNIEHAWNFFRSNTLQHIHHTDIITPIEKEFDTSNDLTMVDYSSVRYNFTSIDSNKYLDLDPDLKSVCQTVQAQTATTGSAYDVNYYSGLWRALFGNDGFANDDELPASIDSQFGDRKLFHQTFGGEDRTFVWWVNEENLCGFRMADQFARKKSPRPDVTEVELNIVPARMVSSYISGGDGHMWQYPMPAVNGEATSYGSVKFGIVESSDNGGLNEDIKSGYKSSDEKRTDVMFVAFWMGNVDVDWENPSWNTPSGLKVPVAAPDHYVQLATVRREDVFWKDFRQVRIGSGNQTMAILGTNGSDAYSYSKNPIVDSTAVYTVKFRCIAIPDIRQIFLIENRKFFCKQLKFRIDAGNRSEICEGTFIPVVSADGSEASESVFYVSYQLESVILANRIYSVEGGGSLDLTLSISGGNASHTIHAVITMGNNNITTSVFTASGRTATISIPSVNGDVFIHAWRE